MFLRRLSELQAFLVCVQELLGLYLNQTGKAANAQAKDAKGNMQAVDVSSLSMDEMVAVANGVHNPLASRDAKPAEDNNENQKQLGSFGLTNKSTKAASSISEGTPSKALRRRIIFIEKNCIGLS